MYSFIPAAYIHQFYERPLDMETLLDDVELYMDEESQHARKKSILIFKPVGYQLKTIDRKTLRENIANFFDSQKASI